MTNTQTYPMAKPPGFEPAIQRYSARFGESVISFAVLVVGVQSKIKDHASLRAFPHAIRDLYAVDAGPEHFDLSEYEDEAGYSNVISIAYWHEYSQYREWWESSPIQDWWSDRVELEGPVGYFVEPIAAKTDALETIAFREYIRGLSACPMSTVESMGESGYWGAARDRIPRSSTDRFDPPVEKPLVLKEQASLGRRLVVRPPKNFCMIRSGVSWSDCGTEQLDSYRANVEPRLNDGMEYLRENPIDSGCWSLRQVRVVDQERVQAGETYVAGHFVSLADLERWAHHHPTHLAIFGQAQKERMKYQDDLELRTYHEVYVVENPERFEYINCHSRTGALGLLGAEEL